MRYTQLTREEAQYTDCSIVSSSTLETRKRTTAGDDTGRSSVDLAEYQPACQTPCPLWASLQRFTLRASPLAAPKRRMSSAKTSEPRAPVIAMHLQSARVFMGFGDKRSVTDGTDASSVAMNYWPRIVYALAHEGHTLRLAEIGRRPPALGVGSNRESPCLTTGCT